VDNSEAAIKEQWSELVLGGVKDKVERRHAIGRCVIALQALRGDVADKNGNVNYGPSRDMLLLWQDGMDIPEHDQLSDRVLHDCTFVALRLSVDQLTVLAAHGMSFYGVRAMLLQYKGDKAMIRKFVGNVKSGKETDLCRFVRKQNAGNGGGTRTSGQGQDADEAKSLTIFLECTEIELADHIASLISLQSKPGRLGPTKAKAAIQDGMRRVNV